MNDLFSSRLSTRRRGGVARSRRPSLAAAGLTAASVVLGLSGHVARAGEILGVLDRDSGILVPAAPSSFAPAAAAAAPVTRQGTFAIVCTITFGPEIPISTEVDGSVSIATSDAKFNNQVTTAGRLTRSGNTRTLTLYLPYYWTVASAGETVGIYFDASTGASGNYYDFSRSFTVALPQNGAYVPLKFDGAL